MNFFKSVATITLLGMLSVFLVILYINGLLTDMANLKPPKSSMLLLDIKNILYGIFVGLIFSFLFSLQTIRSFILKSVSNFMTDDGYLSKLEKSELEKLKDKAFNVLHGVDLASNEQSLFNYIKKLDQFMSTPHKSIVNEFWTIDYFDKARDLFLTKRVQEYRVHTLDKDKHENFDVIYKYVINVSDENKLQDIKDNFKLLIEVNGSEYKIDNLNDANDILIENSYDKEAKIYSIFVKKEIILKKEYTKIHLVATRVEEIDDSIALVSNHATYGMNYSIYLPEDFYIKNVYHHDTLYSEGEKQVSVEKDKNKVSIDINGWHLPGLIFVLTYNKKDKS